MADVPVVRPRPLYLTALALALAGLVAYLALPPVVGRQHEQAKARALAILGRLPDPAAATARPPRACPGGETQRCLRVTRDVDAATAELAAALGAAAGRPAGRVCHDQEMRTKAAPVPTRDCLLRITTGRGHGVLVAVSTAVDWVDGQPRVTGSNVDIGAY